MRRTGFIILVCFGVPSAAQARDITVASWNVQNLFDTHKDTDEPGEPVLTDKQLHIKLTKLAEVIRTLQADIVGLVEVENRNLLRKLCTEYLPEDRYDYFMLIEETDRRGIDVAMISKLPFTAFSFAIPGHTRGILACRFTYDGDPFYVLVNHWKSHIDGGGEIRMACAQRTVELTRDVLPRYEGHAVPMLIVGDLNDSDDAESVLTLEQAGLTNMLKELPQSKRWTMPWWNARDKKVEYDAFDHVFANAEMIDHKGIDVVPGSARVVRPEFMVRKRMLNGVEYDWLDNSFLRHIGYSDHFPVSIRVQLPRSAPSQN